MGMNLITDSQLDALADMLANRVLAAIEAKVMQKWISRSEYAARTSLSLRTIDARLADGRLEFRKGGRRVLIEASQLTASRAMHGLEPRYR